ncbi:MAG TPA: hypothetical protein VF950_09905 [Planctomycetota bacterium]
MKSLWIPLGSFVLAVALSALSGSSRPVSARQSGGTSGCECKLKIMSQRGGLSWATINAAPSSDALKSLSISNSAVLCVSSTTPNDKWTAKWTATNIFIHFLAFADNTPVLGSQVVPIVYAEDSGKAPCKPAEATAKGFSQQGNFDKAAEDAVRRLVQSQYPNAKKIRIEGKLSLHLSPTFDWTVEAGVGCGAKEGPLALSIATFTQPKTAVSGNGSNSATYTTSCP